MCKDRCRFRELAGARSQVDQVFDQSIKGNKELRDKVVRLPEYLESS